MVAAIRRSQRRRRLSPCPVTMVPLSDAGCFLFHFFDVRLALFFAALASFRRIALAVRVAFPPFRPCFPTVNNPRFRALLSAALAAETDIFLTAAMSATGERLVRHCFSYATASSA